MNSSTFFSQKGVGLLEVLITLVVVSFGLLGLAALQTRAQLSEMEAYHRAQALILIEDMANRMNANRPYRDCYDLSTASVPYVGTGVEFVASGCDGRADADLAAWDDLLSGAAESLDGIQSGTMIGGRGCIVRLDDNLFEISVVWQGMSSTVAPTGRTCAQGLYGEEPQRRVITRIVRYATLN